MKRTGHWYSADGGGWRGLRENLDVVSFGLLSLALGLLIVFFPDAPAPLRTVLSFVFLLLAPGYALTALLFPARGDVDAVERLALSLGLSIVAVPLLGLLLNYTPWSMHLLPMTLGLVGLTLAALLAAFQRRQRLAPAQRFFSRHNAPAFPQAAGFLLVVVLLGASVVVTAQALRPPRAATEFYLVGPGGRLEGFPNALRPGQPFTLTLGIRNYEGRAEVYRVYLPFADDGGVIEVPKLENGETWEKTLALRAPRGAGRTQLPIELYRAGSDEPYRSLHLFVTLTATPQPLSYVAVCPGTRAC